LNAISIRIYLEYKGEINKGDRKEIREIVRKKDKEIKRDRRDINIRMINRNIGKI
jgi:hypothetical protein